VTKAARLAWLVSVAAIAGASGMLAFLLSISTTAQRGFLERHYLWLFWVNVAVATALIIVIGVAGTRLALRVKRGRFGSRLLLKLAGIFAFVGVVPGVLIYTVSYQFVNRSIESLFDQRLASALEAGLALGQDTLDNARSELSARPAVRPSAGKTAHSRRWRWSGCATSCRPAAWHSWRAMGRCC